MTSTREEISPSAARSSATSTRHEAIPLRRSRSIAGRWPEYEELAAGGGALHRMSLAIALLKVGETLGHPAYPNVGDVPGAIAAVERSRDIVAALVAADSADHRASRVLGVLYSQPCDPLIHQRRRRRGPSSISVRALELARVAADDDPANRAARRDLAKSIQLGGDLHVKREDYDAAQRSHAEARQLFETLLAEEPEDLLARRGRRVRPRGAWRGRSSARERGCRS